MEVLDKNQQQLEEILRQNPSWNALEAWEGLSGLTATERQLRMVDTEQSYSGLNDERTIQSIPAQVHERRRVLFEYVPFIFPAKTLWSLVDLRRYDFLNQTPKGKFIAGLADLPWMMERFIENEELVCIPPAHPVITTFQEVVGRDPKPAAIRHYLRDWEVLNYNQEELRKAIISGMNS